MLVKVIATMDFPWHEQHDAEFLAVRYSVTSDDIHVSTMISIDEGTSVSRPFNQEPKRQWNSLYHDDEQDPSQLRTPYSRFYVTAMGSGIVDHNLYRWRSLYTCWISVSCPDSAYKQALSLIAIINPVLVESVINI